MVGSNPLSTQRMKNMNRKLLLAIFVTCFLFSVVVLSQISYCQTSTPTSTIQPTPTKASIFGGSNALFLIVGIVAVVAVAVVVTSVFVLKKRVNEKSLSRISSHDFEAWVIKK